MRDLDYSMAQLGKARVLINNANQFNLSYIKEKLKIVLKADDDKIKAFGFDELELIIDMVDDYIISAMDHLE